MRIVVPIGFLLCYVVWFRNIRNMLGIKMMMVKLVEMVMDTTGRWVMIVLGKVAMVTLWLFVCTGMIGGVCKFLRKDVGVGSLCHCGQENYFVFLWEEICEFWLIPPNIVNIYLCRLLLVFVLKWHRMLRAVWWLMYRKMYLKLLKLKAGGVWRRTK